MTAFKKEELIGAGELRTLSQKELFHALEEHGKLGILYKDTLAAVMLPHDRYVALKERLQELESMLHTEVKG